MVATADLINLSPPKSQYFPFQKPFINYIFENSSLILSQKLIKCCKFFKFLHLRINEARVNRLWIYPSSCKINGGLSESSLSNTNECHYKIDTIMKKIKILYEFELVGFFDYYFTTLLPKLDLSRTKEIKIRVTVELKREMLDQIIPPSLEKLVLNSSFENVNPALFVFQRCPKIKEIDILPYDNIFGHHSVPVLTKNILKEILLTKSENKIKKLVLNSVSLVDMVDFLKLIDNKLSSNCFILFVPKDADILNSYKEMFAKINEIRPKSDAGINIRLYFQGSSYAKFL